MKRKIVEVKVELAKFMTHLLAPFYGKPQDDDGLALPSKREKSWSFSLHNAKKNTHLTFTATRAKGEYESDPVKVSLSCTNYDRVIATVGKNTFTPEVVYTDHEKLGLETLKWIVDASNEGWDCPDHIRVLAESRCARCRLALTNPTSVEWFFGPTCRKRVGIVATNSKTAKAKG